MSWNVTRTCYILEQENETFCLRRILYSLSIFLSVAVSPRIESWISKMEAWRRTCSHCFVVALVLQQHRPSNSKVIVYRQIFQQHKGKSIDFMLVYYTVSPVLQVRSFFPFDSADDESRMVSNVIFDAPFKKSSWVSPPCRWPVTTVEVLSGIIPPHLLGFKWLWPSPFRI